MPSGQPGRRQGRGHLPRLGRAGSIPASRRQLVSTPQTASSPARAPGEAARTHQAWPSLRRSCASPRLVISPSSSPGRLAPTDGRQGQARGQSLVSYRRKAAVFGSLAALDRLGETPIQPASTHAGQARLEAAGAVRAETLSRQRGRRISVGSLGALRDGQLSGLSPQRMVRSTYW